MKTKKKLPWLNKVYFVAEAGVNHNGNITLAKKLIKAAKYAGADAVKFQTWYPGELTGKFAKKIDYLKKNTSKKQSRYDISKKLCLPYKSFFYLKKYAKKISIDFLSTPDGEKSLDFVSGKLNVPYIKVASTELNNLPYLKAIAEKQKPVLLSTGMGTLKEVKVAIKTLKKYGKKKLPIVVLQCTTQYPCKSNEMNLNVIKTFSKLKGVEVGLSDHSTGNEASIAAVVLGAKVIEKHLTLNKNMIGPDHKASMQTEDLKKLIQSIRNMSSMMGDGIKRPTANEKKIIPQVRRGIVASRNLKKGTKIKLSDLSYKRPATGMPISKTKSLINKTTLKNIFEDEPIKKSFVK